MFTYETMELFRITRLSELGMSHIADNVVLLQHFQDGSDMKRALTVLKSQGLDELDRHPRVQDLGRRHHPRRADQPRSIRPLSELGLGCAVERSSRSSSGAVEETMVESGTSMPDRSMRIAVAFAREAALSPSARRCRACREVLEVNGAGLTLMAGRSSGPLCATSTDVGVLEEIQFTAGEGPCRDAFESQGSVHAPRMDDAAFAKWPSFVELARRSGIAGVFAYPLVSNGSKVGVMTLYQRTPGDLTAQQHDDSIVVAEVITETVLSLQADADPGELGPGLDGRTVYRAEIHQAAGMVAVQLQIPVDEAMVRLRGHALANDLSLTELASSIVARRYQLGDDRDSMS